jgi:hypothetical protein
MSTHSRTNTATNKTNQNKNNSILNLRNSSILNSLSNNTPDNSSMSSNNSNILSSKNSSVFNNSNMPNNNKSMLSSSNNNSMSSNNSNILSSKNSSVLNSSNMLNRSSTRFSHVVKSSSMWSRVPGSITVLKTGSQTTAPGNSVAATAVIVSRTIATVDTLGRSMGSESTGFLSWWLVDIRASSTRVIGLVSLTHGRGPGQITGMTPMTSMFLTSATGTTCITAGIPGLELPSAFRCSGFVGVVRPPQASMGGSDFASSGRCGSAKGCKVRIARHPPGTIRAFRWSLQLP